MKKEKTKRSNKSIGFLMFVLVVFVGIVSVQISNLYTQNHQIETEAAALLEEKESALAKQQELLDYKAFMNTTDYIEQLARDKFGLIKPGETLFVTKKD